MQDKAMHYNINTNKTIQENTTIPQYKIRQYRTKEDNALQDKTIQDTAIHYLITWDKTRQYNTIQYKK